MLAHVRLGAAKERIRDVDLRWLGLAALSSVAVFAMRGLRFRTLTTRAGLRSVTTAIGVQNFVLRVTPFRLGELSLPIILSRHCAEPSERTLVSLLLVRLLELWVVLAAGVVAVLTFFGPRHFRGAWVAALALAGISLLLLTFRFWMKVVARATQAVIARTRLRAVERVRAFGERLERSVAEILEIGTRRRVLLWSANLAVAAFQYVMLGCLAHAFALDLSVPQTIVGVSVAQVTSAVPLATVGNVGTYEAGWTMGFVAVGVSFDAAVVTAVASQIITLLFAALLALPSWFALSRSSAAGAAGRNEPKAQS
jgi:glycosyltransferase 2 family protein